MVAPVPKEYFHLVWDEAKEHLRRFEKRAKGRCTVDDIGKRILSGEQQLWIILNDDKEIIGSIVTQVWDYPRKKVAEIVACGGDSSNELNEYIFQSMSVIEDFALENYCDVIRIEGRKGWLKPLSKMGFEQSAVLLEKEI
jgi:hypothetical protein